MRTPRYPRSPITKIGNHFIEEWVGEFIPSTSLQLVELLRSTPTCVLYLARGDSDDTYGARFVRNVPGAASSWESRAERLEALGGARVVRMGRRVVMSDWIITLYDWGDGVQLNKLVAREGALPYDSVTSLSHELCLALEELHSAGFTHGELDPEHVLVSTTGDFGVVRLTAFDLYTSNAQAPGTAVRSQPFWAPEQVRGEAPTISTDLYQLGATMFFALTGRAPFEAKDPWALAASQFAGARRASQFLPEVRDTALDHLIADPVSYTHLRAHET